MKKCDCYHENTERHYFNDWERGFNYANGKTAEYEDRTYGVCWGTKECDMCSCGGDRTKCDFYLKDENKKCKLSFVHGNDCEIAVSNNKLNPSESIIINTNDLRIQHNDVSININISDDVLNQVDNIIINGFKFVKKEMNV